MTGLKAVVHIYNGILSAIRKNEFSTFAATWKTLEEIMLSEIISQAEKDNYHMISLI